MIIKEYKCLDCQSFFESSDADPACPQCSAPEPERAFLTPPGFKSPQTSGKDRDLQALAQDFGLSNMSNRDGAPVKQAPTGGQAPQFAAQTPQNMQLLQKLGNAGDGFSGVLPALQRAGRPHQWQRERLKQ